MKVQETHAVMGLRVKDYLCNQNSFAVRLMFHHHQVPIVIKHLSR